jgi:hypothetical protein
MRRGSILELILGIILIVSALTISFLSVVGNEVAYVAQISPCTDFLARSDSALSVAVVNLHSYVDGECDLPSCRKRIDACIGEDPDGNTNLILSVEDNKIPLCPAFLDLLRHLFLTIGVRFQDAAALICELEEFFAADRLSLAHHEQMLALPTFKSLFLGEDGFFTEKWRLFTENTTCQDTEAIALHDLSDELLRAICALENWRFEDAKSALGEASFLDNNSQNNPIVNLYEMGCAIRDQILFKERSSCFKLTVTSEMDELRLVDVHFIKHDAMGNFCGFPFVIISLTNKF